jgi:hypothetical protein
MAYPAVTQIILIFFVATTKRALAGSAALGYIFLLLFDSQLANNLHLTHILGQ